MNQELSHKPPADEVERSTERSFAEAVKSAREQKGLSTEALAEKLGLRREIMEKIEEGTHAPSTWIFREICEALDISVDEQDELWMFDEKR